MNQKESVALVYALARKSLERGSGHESALKEIARTIERDFMGERRKLDDRKATETAL